MPHHSNPPILPARRVVLSGEEGTAVTATVTSVQRRENDGVYGHIIGLEAHLQLVFPDNDQPYTYVMSRLVDEPYWVIDGLFGPNSFPHFNNGFGARYLKLRGVARELEALLDEAARRQGLVRASAPNTPLVLADPSAQVSTGDRPIPPN